MRILIKNGTVVTSADQYQADVLVEGEQVVALETNSKAAFDEVVDAAGK